MVRPHLRKLTERFLPDLVVMAHGEVAFTRAGGKRGRGIGQLRLHVVRVPQAALEPAREGVLGDPAGAPWDRILVSAGARDLPQALARPAVVE